MTGLPSGSEPLRVYTAAPTGVLSLTTCRFMSAVNEGGRLAVTPARQEKYHDSVGHENRGVIMPSHSDVMLSVKAKCVMRLACGDLLHC